MGPYRLVGRLGQGGQGVVYLGEDAGGGRAAIKVMNGGIDRSFARELAAARKVNEFCTARVLVADLDHEPPYVVSEYIEGPALAGVAPLRGAALTRLAIGTATALAAIHRAGVVHRDFKPGNVLMGQDGPRVIDFGIARIADATATRGGAVGTPPYMSPEQFSGDPVGPASDVFAWGATMTFAGTGRPPFGQEAFAAVAYRILHGEPDLGDLPEPLRSIVARCLAKDPALRPSARDVLLDLLEMGAQGDPRGGAADDPLARGAALAATSGDPGRTPQGPPRRASEHRPEPVPEDLSRRSPEHLPQGESEHLPQRVSRRKALLGAGAALGAAAVAGGVLWWRGVLPGDARPGDGGTSAATGGSSAPGDAPTGDAPTRDAAQASGSESARAEPSESEQPEPSVTAPPGDGTRIAIAVEGALTLTPLADLSFQGGLTQSSFAADARGRIAYRSDVGFSTGSCDFAVRIAPDESESDPPANVTILSTGDQSMFIDGKPHESDTTHHIKSYVDMVVVMGGLGVLLDLVARTPQVNKADRRYSGGLPTPEAPDQVKGEILQLAGWKDEQLKGTRVTWRLELDELNRPTSYRVAWWYQDLASTFTSTYTKWREGEIRRP
ncbi:serine/threonine protein kinase [Nonomuraea sp. NN258]|uniref:serine/threonine protein kinase n=1 Tax=Nonomuraea antri TaxID=2730852 RepID=UPI00156840D4|nr:serine/threonine-protein kinase [Nonomuraea antri]NRQ39884.1 serine/threonine protein kinase [Nonomuraea antri]